MIAATKRVLVGVLLILALAGCSPISAGHITNKVYEAPYDYLTYSCASYNKDGFCTVNIPIWHHVDAQYRFDLEQADKTGWVYVNEPTFNSYEIGDFYGEADTN